MILQWSDSEQSSCGAEDVLMCKIKWKEFGQTNLGKGGRSDHKLKFLGEGSSDAARRVGPRSGENPACWAFSQRQRISIELFRGRLVQYAALVGMCLTACEMEVHVASS